MDSKIPEHHSLRRFFTALAYEKFVGRLGWNDVSVAEYISNLLVEFTHIDNLFRIRSQKGRRLEEVGEMLLEADVLLNAGAYEREREVYRHIGDFTLFMVGVFPEYLQRIKSRRLIHHPDFLVDYVKVGKRSYENVSGFDAEDSKGSVLLFRRLADNFELCVVGLGYIRRDLETAKDPKFAEARTLLQN
jgi:hypothetical protein